MQPLITNTELAGLAAVAEGLMNSEIRIYSSSDEDSPLAPPNDSWDDSTEGGAAADDDAEPTAVVRGWFRNQPDYDINDLASAIGHQEDARLFVPLDTQLHRRDKVVVLPLDATGIAVEPGTAYRVVDTNIENTWKVLIRASLRKWA